MWVSANLGLQTWFLAACGNTRAYVDILSAHPLIRFSLFHLSSVLSGLCLFSHFPFSGDPFPLKFSCSPLPLLSDQMFINSSCAVQSRKCCSELGGRAAWAEEWVTMFWLEQMPPSRTQTGVNYTLKVISIKRGCFPRRMWFKSRALTKQQQM